jgi:hypothetical protein
MIISPFTTFPTVQTPLQIVPLAPSQLPPTKDENSRNSMHLYGDEGPYLDPAVYESTTKVPLHPRLHVSCVQVPY